MVIRRRSNVAMIALWLVGLAASTAAAQDTSFRVQYGVRVSPETVTVGDPLRVIVRVRAPMGAEIVFPRDPDTTGAVQPRDPRTVRTAGDTTALDQTATYTLSAWDVDSQVVRLGDVVVRYEGEERRIAVGQQMIFVRSVLPADSAQRVPKPPRPLVAPRAWPWWIALVVAALALLALGIWWWRRRRRSAVEVAEDPYELATREFARIEALRLPDAGEPGRHVALMVDVLRDYLAVRVPSALRSATSIELMAALRTHRLVPRDRLARLLVESDLVKFARSPVSREHAYQMGRDAAAIVEEVQTRITADEAAAREREARAAKKEAA